jgi:hypothetical protein
MKVSDLSKDRKAVKIDLGDGSDVNLTFNPSSYTIEMEEQMEEASKGEFKGKALSLMLGAMIVDWDLYQEAEGDFPPTDENLKKLPVTVLGKFAEAIGNAARPSSEEGKA